MSKSRNRVPGAEDWAGYREDLDVKHSHKLLFGKSRAQVQEYFGGTRSIQRASELLFMPRRAFQYYVLAFADFLRSDGARGDSDSASPFLRLLAAREDRDPGSVTEIYEHLVPTVDFVASHQEYFDADPTIYGSFSDLARDLRRACEAHERRDA